VHVFRPGGYIQPGKHDAQPVGVLRLNAGFRPSLEKLFVAFVPKTFNHVEVYNVALQGASCVKQQ
jgi:hypothetical protein